MKGFESARHLLSASPVIPLRWNQVMEVLLCPRSLDSSHQVSGLKFWLDKLDLGATLWLLCPTHTFASWKKASRGISLSIKWLEEKCLKLPNAVRGSVHIYADLKRCSWADGQTLPFIHPPAALSDFGDQCLSMFSLLPHIRS